MEQITTCGVFTDFARKFSNESCTTTFNQTNDRFTCECAYEPWPAYYSVLEDVFERAPPDSLGFATYRDWATFGVLAWVCSFTLSGIMYTYNKDISDFKLLRDLQFKKDADLIK